MRRLVFLALAFFVVIVSATANAASGGIVFHAPLTSGYTQSSTVATDVSVNNNHCTVAAGTPTIGARYTDFANGEYMNCSGDWTIFNETTPFTMSIWVDFPPIPSYYPWIFAMKGAGNSFAGINHTWQEKIVITIRDESINQLTLTSTSTLDSGWHHIVLAYNGANTMDLYVDGQPDGSDSSPTISGVVLDNGLSIGDKNYMSYAQLDFDARIYSRYFGQYDVSALFAQGQYLTRTMIPATGGNLAFDAPLTSGYTQDATTLTDLAGGYHLTSVGGGTIDGAGFTGDSGTGKYLVSFVDGFLSSQHVGTVSIWFKTTETSSNIQALWSADTALDTYYIGAYIQQSVSYTPVWVARSGATIRNLTGTTTGLNDGAWHNFVITTNGSRTLLYLDGQPESFTTPSDPDTGDFFADVANRDNLCVGVLCRKNPIVGSNATFAVPKVYTVELSASEVLSIYNQGPYAFRQSLFETSGNLVFSAPFTKGYMQSATVVSDVSVNGNDCTAVGSPGVYTSMTALSGGYFNCGVPSGVSFSESTPFTVSAWLRYEPLPSGSVPLVTITGTGTSEVAIKHGWTEYISVSLTDDSSNVLTVPSLATRDREIIHVVGTYDGANTLDLYIDGVYQGSDTSPTLSGLNPNSTLFVGDNISGGTYPDYVADVRLYDGYFSQGDVTELYQNSRYVLSIYDGIGTDAVNRAKVNP